MTNNVVTYTVEVLTDNSNGKLLPYLTANLQFEVDRRRKVLTVSNEALRWKPGIKQVTPSARAALRKAMQGGETAEAGKAAARLSGAAQNRGLGCVPDGAVVRRAEA